MALCPPSLRVFIAWIDIRLTHSLEASEVIKAIQRGEVDARVVLALTEEDHSACPHTEGLSADGEGDFVDCYTLTSSFGDQAIEWGKIDEESNLWTRAEQLIHSRRMFQELMKKRLFMLNSRLQ